MAAGGGMETFIGSTAEPHYSIVVDQGSVYHFKVQAVNLAGGGVISNEVDTPSLPTKAATPVMVITGNDVTLNWDVNPTEQLVTSYKVHMNVNGGMTMEAVEVLGTSHTLVDLVPGVYNFFVQAVNLAGAGALSDAAVTPSLPSAPLDLVLTIAVS